MVKFILCLILLNLSFLNVNAIFHQSKSNGIWTQSIDLKLAHQKDLYQKNEQIHSRILQNGLLKDTLINSFTVDEQSSPKVAIFQNGNFVFVWQSKGQIDAFSPNFYDVYAQFYDMNGLPISNELLINNYTDFDQKSPSLALLNDGNILFGWLVNTTEFRGVIYSEYGVVVQEEFVINSAPLNPGSSLSLSNYKTGFVATWTGSTPSDIYFEMFDDSTYTAISPEAIANLYTTNSQTNSFVTGLSDGSFVIVWYGEGTGGTIGIHAKRFDDTGAVIASEFLVKALTTLSQVFPKVEALSTGGYIIVWNGDGSTDTSGIFARIYDSSDIAQGTSEFQVNTFTTNEQVSPSVASIASGDVVITWASSGQDPGDSIAQYGIYAKILDNSGAEIKAEFRVNTYTSGSQMEPCLSALLDGGFVIVWSGEGERDDLGVYAQRFDSTGAAVTSLYSNLGFMMLGSTPSIEMFKYNQEYPAYTIMTYNYVPCDPVLLNCSDGIHMAYNTLVNKAIGKQDVTCDVLAKTCSDPGIGVYASASGRVYDASLIGCDMTASSCYGMSLSASSGSISIPVSSVGISAYDVLDANVEGDLNFVLKGVVNMIDNMNISQGLFNAINLLLFNLLTLPGFIVLLIVMKLIKKSAMLVDHHGDVYSTDSGEKVKDLDDIYFIYKMFCTFLWAFVPIITGLTSGKPGDKEAACDAYVTSLLLFGGDAWVCRIPPFKLRQYIVNKFKSVKADRLALIHRFLWNLVILILVSVISSFFPTQMDLGVGPRLVQCLMFLIGYLAILQVWNKCLEYAKNVAIFFIAKKPHYVLFYDMIYEIPKQYFISQRAFLQIVQNRVGQDSKKYLLKASWLEEMQNGEIKFEKVICLEPNDRNIRLMFKVPKKNQFKVELITRNSSQNIQDSAMELNCQTNQSYQNNQTTINDSNDMTKDSIDSKSARIQSRNLYKSNITPLDLSSFKKSGTVNPERIEAYSPEPVKKNDINIPFSRSPKKYDSNARDDFRLSPSKKNMNFDPSIEVEVAPHVENNSTPKTTIFNSMGISRGARSKTVDNKRYRANPS